jgi:hypothetical protein
MTTTKAPTLNSDFDERDWENRTLRVECDSITTADGVRRLLGLIPSALYGAGVLPEKPIDLAELVPQGELEAFDSWPPDLPILNQGEWNACTWFSSCQALQFARFQSGQGYIPLDCLYSYLIVTGGRNTGTNILQAAQAIEDHGIPPVGSTAGPDVKEQAYRFRMQLTDQLVTWPQILSAVARRRPVVGSVCVGNAYMQLDSEGVMGVTRGRANHAIMFGGGLKFSPKHGWCVKHAGSWGTSWGQKGFGWYSEAHFEHSTYGEAYTTRAVHEDLAVDVPPPIAEPIA